jgi:NhaA family Na+:H+ antiporter
MYRVSTFIRHFAIALAAGSVLATLWVNLSPESYYDVMEARLVTLSLPQWIMPDHARITLISVTSELLMALFFFLMAKELWEATMLARGALHGMRAGLPLLASLGAAAGAMAVWVLVSTLIETALEARPGIGWQVPIGGDTIIAYIVGRQVFGRSHPALHLLLLVCIGLDLMGLAALVPQMPVSPPRLLWLALPVAAAVGVWVLAGRHAQGRTERERQEALHLWPYVLAGAVSWIGVVAAGLPGALGFLPVIPAIPHARRAFGMFAEAEELLHDPLNRLAHLTVRPLMVVLFLFGLTRGGIDLGAFAPTTVVTLAALWFGKPLGLMAGVLVALRLLRLPLPQGVDATDLLRIGLLTGIGFTVPLVALQTALPGGAMAEAARLGLALSLLMIPVVLTLFRTR